MGYNMGIVLLLMGPSRTGAIMQGLVVSSADGDNVHYRTEKNREWQSAIRLLEKRIKGDNSKPELDNDEEPDNSNKLCQHIHHKIVVTMQILWFEPVGGLCYKLRIAGVPIDRSTTIMCCGNEPVIIMSRNWNKNKKNENEFKMDSLKKNTGIRNRIWLCLLLI